MSAEERAEFAATVAKLAAEPAAEEAEEAPAEEKGGITSDSSERGRVLLPRSFI